MMKKLISSTYTLFLILLFLTYLPTVNGQGCVAIRGNSTCSTQAGNSSTLQKGAFNIQMGYRYFKSFRHFRGDVEETHRIEDGTEVINKSHFLDLSLSYGITERLYANVILPIVFHNRSSMYEHGGNPPNGLGERHETSSKGISDMRFGVGYWLFDPHSHNFNYALGVGIKLNTGSYDYTDQFYNQGSNKDENIEKVVDQSIQPGDGGVGLTIDLQGYHALNSKFGIQTNLFYLLNFQETNGVLTRNGNSTFSCPDQFAARLGAYYSTLNGLSLSLGWRAEGVPASDLIGGSEGYRRPGYALSIEPGVGYAKGNFAVFASVPVAFYRNRIQSFEDKQRTIETGVYRHGDAAFADYLINISFSYRFNPSHSNHDSHNVSNSVRIN